MYMDYKETDASYDKKNEEKHLKQPNQVDWQNMIGMTIKSKDNLDMGKVIQELLLSDKYCHIVYGQFSYIVLLLKKKKFLGYQSIVWKFLAVLYLSLYPHDILRSNQNCVLVELQRQTAFYSWPHFCLLIDQLLVPLRILLGL